MLNLVLFVSHKSGHFGCACAHNLVMTNSTLTSFSQQIRDSSWPPATQAALALFLGAGLSLLLSNIVSKRGQGKIRDLGGISIVTAWTFFTKRYDFLRHNFKTKGYKMFQFYVLQVSVIHHCDPVIRF